jgi:hypothetical protein
MHVRFLLVPAAASWILAVFALSDVTLHPIHRSIGVSRSLDSEDDFSSAGALKASLTPSNKPMCRDDSTFGALHPLGATTNAVELCAIARSIQHRSAVELCMSQKDALF